MITFLKKYNFSLLVILSFVVWFASYSKVPFIFFQQDELMGFGLFILKGVNMLYTGFGFKDMVHFVPVTMSLSFSLFNLFGLNPIPYNIIGLIFHTVNGLLIYLLGQKIFKNKVYSLISLILFLSSSAGAELVMWPVINLNTISLTFALLAIHIQISAYIKNGLPKTYEYVYISLFFLLAVFSVEYAAGMIFIIPVVGYIMDRKNKGIKKLKNQWPFYATVVGYLLFRFLPVVFLKQSTSLDSVVATGITERLVSLIRLPFVYLSQLFLGQTLLIDISQFISNVFYNNTANTQFAEGVLFKYVAIFAGILIVLLFTKIIVKVDGLFQKYLLIFLFFIILSSLPFALVPGQTFSIISSRYLYFGAVGYAFLLVLVLKLVVKLQNKKHILIYTLFLILMIFSEVRGNYEKGNLLYKTGMTRINILNSIKTSYPELPKKVVFYTQSNKSYYGLADDDKILPFQSGLGQTLYLWYYSDEKFSKNFFKEEFLWGILSEGYKSEGEQGFGYFRNYENLKVAVIANKLKPESVIAFKWDANSETLTDITEEIRIKLKNEIKFK